jgi:RNA polymerase I-specific transcription initiation factor RRN3
METIPSSMGIITSSIASTFPFSLADARKYIDYVGNLFRMITYDQSLEPTILGLIMEHLVVIDVHVGIELEDLDEDDVAGLMESVKDESQKLDTFQLADIDEEDDTLLDDQEKAEAMALKSTMHALMKLDIVLDLIFGHFNSIIESESPELAFNKVGQLVAMFTSKILVTYNSRHCQYLVFRFGQSNQQVFELFMKELLAIAFDRNRAAAIRCSAITYLASFAARGAQLSGDHVRRVFAIFSKELDRLRTNYDKENIRGPDPDRFRFFYTLFQACMYLFCFRWKDFLLNPEDFEDIHEDIANAKWDPSVRSTFTLNVHCPVNPLKCCSPVVVNQFAYVCSSLKFLFINDIIEQNKRIRLTRVTTMNTISRETALSSTSTEKTLQLEAQYPFEPFSLPRSRKWVDGLYLEFIDPNPNVESSDEEDDDDE